MRHCIFCEEETMADEDDKEGLAGYPIGKTVICSGCMARLKELLRE